MKIYLIPFSSYSSNHANQHKFYLVLQTLPSLILHFRVDRSDYNRLPSQQPGTFLQLVILQLMISNLIPYFQQCSQTHDKIHTVLISFRSMAQTLETMISPHNAYIQLKNKPIFTNKLLTILYLLIHVCLFYLEVCLDSFQWIYG